MAGLCTLIRFMRHKRSRSNEKLNPLSNVRTRPLQVSGNVINSLIHLFASSSIPKHVPRWSDRQIAADRQGLRIRKLPHQKQTMDHPSSHQLETPPPNSCPWCNILTLSQMQTSPHHLQPRNPAMKLPPKAPRRCHHCRQLSTISTLRARASV